MAFGIGSVIIFYIFSGELDSIVPKMGDISELHLMGLIYTIIIRNNADKWEDRSIANAYAIVGFTVILLSGFISMVSDHLKKKRSKKLD